MTRMIKIASKRIQEGDMLPPWYYGIAYRELYSMHVIFYPVPINYMFRFSRTIKYYWNIFRCQPSLYDRRVHNAIQHWKSRAYQRGYEHGMQRGIDIGLMAKGQ